ncbi:MAG TPA: recombinase RecA [Candidatus Methanoperedenaceae archaeon]|nr:recombinase RecA [Candidatus Methanoperedenaceae archaeon]
MSNAATPAPQVAEVVTKPASAAPLIKSTGITMLDRNLGGGIPSGSVIYFLADPMSMAEVFLYQFTQARKTYYFTTERRPKFVEKDINNLNFKINNVVFIDIYSEYYMTPHGEMVDNVGNEYVDSKIVEFTEYHLHKIRNLAEHEVNVIIDSFSFYLSLNVNPGRIKRLLNIIYEMTKETEALTFLYSMKGAYKNEILTEVLKVSDVIFDIELGKSADKIVNRLSVPKIRGMTPNGEVIKFKVGEGINIDTSTDIA